jgi:peroxiredoxin (alkyl hydroperoxide reductase subunit C)
MSTISVDTASVHLELNATVPDFEAQTTAGVIRISEWALNKWVILFPIPRFHASLYYRAC